MKKDATILEFTAEIKNIKTSNEFSERWKQLRPLALIAMEITQNQSEISAAVVEQLIQLADRVSETAIFYEEDG